MRRLSFAFLSVAGVGLLACADVQQPIAPNDFDQGRAAFDRLPSPITIIYSNFGPGMTFDHQFAWGINGPNPFGQQAVSQKFFTAPGTFVLAQAKVALARPTNTGIRIIVQADSLGKPGRFIEELAFDPIASTPTVYVANSVLSPVLRDSLYWLTVAEAGIGLVAAWNQNVMNDVMSTNFAFSINNAGPEGPWVVIGFAPNLKRGAFEIDGRLAPIHGAVVHQASGGGTVIWGSEKVTYGITAQQMVDGSVSGHLQWLRESDHFQYRGTVTCLTVVGNRAFILGEATQPDAAHFPYFAIALEDNGEGEHTTMPDRVSSLNLLPVAPSCGQRFPVPVVDWTNGNVQVR